MGHIHLGLFTLRFFSALMMIVTHGYAKLENYSVIVTTFPDPLGIGAALSLKIAIFTEVLCALLVMIGYYTRIAATGLFITMIVAGLVVHGAEPWRVKELAICYSVIFATLILTGPGHFALESLKRKKK